MAEKTQRRGGLDEVNACIESSRSPFMLTISEGFGRCSLAS